MLNTAKTPCRPTATKTPGKPKTSLWVKIVVACFAFSLFRVAIGAPAEDIIIPSACLLICLILCTLSKGE